MWLEAQIRILQIYRLRQRLGVKSELYTEHLFQEIIFRKAIKLYSKTTELAPCV